VQQENLFLGKGFLPTQSFLLLPRFDYGHTIRLDIGLCSLSCQNKDNGWTNTLLRSINFKVNRYTTLLGGNTGNNGCWHFILKRVYYITNERKIIRRCYSWSQKKV